MALSFVTQDMQSYFNEKKWDKKETLFLSHSLFDVNYSMFKEKHINNEIFLHLLDVDNNNEEQSAMLFTLSLLELQRKFVSNEYDGGSFRTIVIPFLCGCKSSSNVWIRNYLPNIQVFADNIYKQFNIRTIIAISIADLFNLNQYNYFVTIPVCNKYSKKRYNLRSKIKPFKYQEVFRIMFKERGSKHRHYIC